MRIFKSITSHKTFLAVLLAMVIGFGAYLFLAPSKSIADYSGGYLVSDTVFLDAGAMSKSQIQSFLESKGSGLASRSFKLECSGEKTRQWYTAAGAPCDQTIPASHIIYYAAQIYGINPQVILATMQKEQSLITSPNPTSWQINQAMGYGCPDNGGCGASNFYYQVDNGVWVLRLHYERAAGNNTWWRNGSFTCGISTHYYKPSLYPNQDVRFYDDNDVHYRTHFIRNPATSSLYCYTPHAYNNPQGLYGLPKYGTKGQYYSGSYNFVLWFERWFGSTEGTPFFMLAGSSHVYILGSNDTYYKVPNMKVLKAYGYPDKINTVVTKPSSYVSGKTFAGDLTLLARYETDDIYLGVYLMDDGERHHFTTNEMIENVYGFNRTQEESELPVSLSYYYDKTENVVPVIKENGGSWIFLMENGFRRRFVDKDAFNTGDPPYSNRSSIGLSTDFMASLPATYPILGHNKLIRSYDSGDYGFYNGEKLFNIGDKLVVDLGLSPDYNLHSTEISNLPRNSQDIYVKVKNDGHYYLLDTRRKLEINASDLSKYGVLDSEFLAAPSNLLSRIGTQPMSQFVSVVDSGTKFLLSEGKRHRFDDWGAIGEHGFSGSDHLFINSRVMSVFPDSGRRLLPTGTLFRIDGQFENYIITGLSSRLYINSPTVRSEYGFSKSDLRTFTAAEVAGYSTVGNLGYLTKDSGGNVWLVHSGGLNQNLAPAGTCGNFNLNVANLEKLSSRIYQSMSYGGPLKNLLRDSGNRRVYCVQNGQKRWVTSPDAIDRLGYTYDDISLVSSAFLATLPTGSNIN